MTTPQLTRVALQEPGSESALGSVFDQVVRDDTERLAREAKQVLGYKPLVSHVYEEKPRQNDNERLITALRELDIRPFRTKDVARHKRNVLRKINLRPIRLLANSLLLGFGVSLVGTVAGALGWFVGAIFESYSWGSTLVSFTGGLTLGCAGTCVTLIVILKTWMDKRPTLFESVVWAKTPISKYEYQVPEFALATAIAVKQKLPDAEIFVHHLVRIPDPFLVVKLHKSEEIYLEQWNEPDFKAQRDV